VKKMAQSNRILEKRKKNQLLKQQSSMMSLGSSSGEWSSLTAGDSALSHSSSSFSLGLTENPTEESLNTKIYPHLPPYYSQYR